MARSKAQSGRPRKDDSTPMQPRAGGEFVWVGSNMDTTMSRPSRPITQLIFSKTPLQAALLRIMLEEKTFISRFIIGPSFIETELSRLFVSLTRCPDLLLAAFLACSGRFSLLVDAHQTTATHRLEDDYMHSARAVKELRGIGDGSRRNEDLAQALLLGLGVLTFDLFDSGLHAHSICRYTLSLIYGTGVSSGLHLELSEGLIPLVFMDTCNCLVRRKVPISRSTPHREPAGADRYIGLCVPLLAYMYDLCVVSHALTGTVDITNHEAAQKLQALGAAIADWHPILSLELTKAFTRDELQVMGMQATIFRTAALLVAHRIQWAFGSAADDLAFDMAETILAKISSLHPPGTTADVPPFEYRLNLPFLVAAVELRDMGRRNEALSLLRRVVCERMYPRVGEGLRQFLQFVWWARDSAWHGHWFDLAAQGPQFVLF